MGAHDRVLAATAPDACLPPARVLETPRALPLREPAPVTGPIALRQRRVGLSDLRIFPLALGAASFGSRVPANDARRILDTYVDLGGNVLDTADGDDASETVLGTWMRDRSGRDDLVVAANVGRGTAHPGMSVSALTRAVEGSLRRLQTDRIDLLWLGIDDAAVPFEETLLGASALVSAGKVRQIGLADHSGNRMIEARVIAAQHGAAHVVAVQAEYSLLERVGYEQVIAGVARQLALGVLPRLPLAGGELARPRPQRRWMGVPRPSALRRRRVLAVLDEIAAEHHVAAATVAVAWLLSKRNVVAPVVGASSPEQVLDLIAAPSLQLSRHQLTRLDRVSEQRPHPVVRPGRASVSGVVPRMPGVPDVGSTP